MWRPLHAVVAALLLAGCGATGPTDSAGVSDALASAPVSAEPTPAATERTTPSPSLSAEPRSLFGTWRTTLGGEPLSLNLTETTYRIVRGPNAGNGSVTVTGDQIEFFGSDLCTGSAFYRWAISDAGALSFFPVENEPCPGRGEALLVSYPDYSPPGG